MSEQVVAVEPDGYDTMKPPAAEAGQTPPPERTAKKFVYPGGSRPLEGYTIKRGVGHGGFGEIYYAVSDAGKEVALKLIRRNLEVELRGIRHCLNLKHPNLLDLYDIRQDDQGDTWVIMEYVPGASLEEVLSTHPQGLPPEHALAWLHGIGAGVAYLHDHGIVHRDLKPGNIFSSEGLVKVGDYGLSKFISCSRRSGHTESIGTVHYMAPEVANGRYGKEIDIYALGIILYEMLTGRVPFDGESVGEVLMKHLTAKPDVSMLAEPFRSVVARALEKDPAERFRSVGEMLAALPRPVQAPPGAARLPAGSDAAGAAAASAAAATASAAAAVPLGDGPEHPSPEDIVQPVAVDEEPILRAVRETWWRLRTAWDQADLPTAVKIVLLVAGMFLLVHSAAILIPVAISLLICYGVYRLVWMFVRPKGTASWPIRWTAPPAAPVKARPLHPPIAPLEAARPPAQAAQGATTTQGVVPGLPSSARLDKPTVAPARSLRERAVLAMVVKSPRERFTDLLGSLLLGALVTLSMCVVAVLLSSYRGTCPRMEQCAWLLLVSLAGTWAVLIPAKFWEGTRGEVVLRRFAMMVIGLGLGVLASGVAALLLVNLPYDSQFTLGPDYELPHSFYDDGGRPLGMAYLAAFGTLFLVIRWWRQADPLRSTRLSFWSLIVSVVVAGLVAAAWHFPQPWLPMVACTISVSVQLASPWLHPARRLRRGRD